MKIIITWVLLCSSVSIGFSQNNSSNTMVDITNEDNVRNYLIGKTFFTQPDGDDGLYFAFEYANLSKNSMTLWDLPLISKSDLEGDYINVDFSPSNTRCRISGMEKYKGKNLNLYLFPDGHIETESGRVFNEVK